MLSAVVKKEEKNRMKIKYGREKRLYNNSNKR